METALRLEVVGTLVQGSGARVTLTIEAFNVGSKPISAYRGWLLAIATDVYGTRQGRRLEVDERSDIAPGTSRRAKLSYSFDEADETEAFILKNLTEPKSKVELRWTPLAVVFADGTKFSL